MEVLVFYPRWPFNFIQFVDYTPKNVLTAFFAMFCFARYETGN